MINTHTIITNFACTFCFACFGSSAHCSGPCFDPHQSIFIVWSAFTSLCNLVIFKNDCAVKNAAACGIISLRRRWFRCREKQKILKNVCKQAHNNFDTRFKGKCVQHNSQTRRQDGMNIKETNTQHTN